MTHVLLVPLEWAPTRTHTDIAIIHFHWFKVHSVRTVFTFMFPFLVMFHSTPAVMFNKRLSTGLLCLCASVCVCLCMRSQKGSNLLSLAYPGHIRTQASQAFQTTYSFLPQSFTLSFLFPPLHPSISFLLSELGLGIRHQYFFHIAQNVSIETYWKHVYCSTERCHQTSGPIHSSWFRQTSGTQV